MSDKKLREGHSALEGVRAKIKERLKTDDSKIVVGFNGETQVTRQEGDEWQDGEGNTWIRMKGYNMKKGKLDSARIPLWCPKCNVIMNHRWDTKMYNLQGQCFDCTIKSETEMRRNGTWVAHEEKLLRSREIGYLRDVLVELREAYTTISNSEFVNSNGTIERWNVDIDLIKLDLEKDIEQVDSRLKFLEDLENDAGNRGTS